MRVCDTVRRYCNAWFMHALEPAYAAYASKFVIITLHYITLHSNIAYTYWGVYEAGGPEA